MPHWVLYEFLLIICILFCFSSSPLQIILLEYYFWVCHTKNLFDRFSCLSSPSKLSLVIPHLLYLIFLAKNDLTTGCSLCLISGWIIYSHLLVSDLIFHSSFSKIFSFFTLNTTLSYFQFHKIQGQWHGVTRIILQNIVEESVEMSF